MQTTHKSGFVISSIAAFIFALGAAQADPVVPDACSVVKAAHISRIIGKDVKFIPLINHTDKNAAMSMCAYESNAGGHYGFSIREVAELPEGTTAQTMLNKAIETLMRTSHSAKGLSQPNVGDAALWNARAQQLTVWVDDGRTTLTFLGSNASASLRTHIAIARRVIRRVR